MAKKEVRKKGNGKTKKRRNAETRTNSQVVFHHEGTKNTEVERGVLWIFYVILSFFLREPLWLNFFSSL